MRKAARRRLLLASAKLYFDAAPIAAEAAMFADDAASAAAVAAVLADIAAEAAPESGVVTTVVVDGAIVAGGVTVVVSSFLLHAANETAAARVTINSAVFMFLLDFKFGQLPAIVGTLFGRRAPSSGRHGKLEHFQCLTQHYRGLRCFP
jgi:hypothetical protein